MYGKDPQNFAIGALLGGAIAVASVLLLTPYSGTQLRQKISAKLNTHAAAPKKKGAARRAVKRKVQQAVKAAAKPLAVKKRKKSQNHAKARPHHHA